MNNYIVNNFEMVMRINNIRNIPEKSLCYKKNLRFSSILNIEDKYKEFFVTDNKYWTIQKCFRTTSKILSIVGKEGVATPFTHMMSFFLMKQDNLDLSLNIVEKIFRIININPNDITMAISEKMLLKCSLKVNYNVCILKSKHLETSLGDSTLKGEYIKFYFRNSNGLIPIGSLNVLEKNNKLAIDSSFLLELLTVVHESSDSLYDSSIFNNSMNILEELRWYTDSDYKKYRLLNYTRAIIILLSNNIKPNSKSRGYVVRKLIRELVVDYYLNCLDKNRKVVDNNFLSKINIYRFVNSIIYDLKLFGDNVNGDNINIENIISEEIYPYIDLINNCIGLVKTNTITQKERLLEEKGMPLEIYNYINNYNEDDNENEIPMNPLFDVIDLNTIEWIKKLHHE